MTKYMNRNSGTPLSSATSHVSWPYRNQLMKSSAQPSRRLIPPRGRYTGYVLIYSPVCDRRKVMRARSWLSLTALSGCGGMPVGSPSL